MSAPLDRFNVAKIFGAALVHAISVKDARRQLQSHIAVDVMIEGLDHRFTDSIKSNGCTTCSLFLECTFASLPPTLCDVYSAAMIAFDYTPIRCEKQSPQDTLSVAIVFCFYIR